MKKIFTLVALASIFTIVSCGPSAEQKAATEKATQDSIAAIESARVAEEATRELAMVDSTNSFNAAHEAEMTRVADSTEAAPTGKKK